MGGYLRIGPNRAQSFGDGVFLSIDTALDLPDCCPEYAPLRAALSGLTGDTVRVDYDGRLTLQARGRRTINCIPTEGWPEPPAVTGDAVSFDGDALREALNFVKGAAYDGMDRPMLCGVHLNGSDVVATDGQVLRLARVSASLPALTLPPPSVAMLSKLLTGPCDVVADERRARIGLPNGSLTTALVSMPFPTAYRKLIPEDEGTRLTAQADEILRVVQSLASFAEGRTKTMTLEICGGNVTLSCRDAEEPLDVVLSDDGNRKVKFDGGYMAEMLGAYGKNEVTITLPPGELRPLLFSDSAGKVGVQMPLKF
jgi:DNA polymerase III sliding clamp (beta) subunit (PCNA family)